MLMPSHLAFSLCGLVPGIRTAGPFVWALVTLGVLVPCGTQKAFGHQQSLQHIVCIIVGVLPTAQKSNIVCFAR